MPAYDPNRVATVYAPKNTQSAYQSLSNSSDHDSADEPPLLALPVSHPTVSRAQYHAQPYPQQDTSRSQSQAGHYAPEHAAQQQPADHHHYHHHHDSNGYAPYDHSQIDSAELPALQDQGNPAATHLEPITEDDPRSYDLVAPASSLTIGEGFSLEKRGQALFSREHLQVIFADPSSLLKFTTFLGQHRPESVPLLVHYLDALKALRAVHYANAICAGLDPVEGAEFTQTPVKPLAYPELESRASAAFDLLAREELPAYITHCYIAVVSISISSRITGSLAPHLREASEGLAEVFCLTDPARPDNPIVFASEEFNRTTQYGMSYALGRNCRFLQGPWTNPTSVRRLRDAIAAGKQHQEVFLNYRRDGSPFMNLLMIAPLCDSRGVIRYFIGAQVDVSGLVKECSEMESLQRLLELQERGEEAPDLHRPNAEKNDELRELSEMLNSVELGTVRKHGGRMHREVEEDMESVLSREPRLLIKDPGAQTPPLGGAGAAMSGRLSGIYRHYLLVRPYPSLRILFASPSLRVPGILQSPLMAKIGGSNRVRDELTAALAEGRGVTAKVRWVSTSNPNDEGRNRWIHCTPLVGSSGQIGVWMVVIVDDPRDAEVRRGGDGGRRLGRSAPPVAVLGAERSRTPGLGGDRSRTPGLAADRRDRSGTGTGTLSGDSEAYNAVRRSEARNGVVYGSMGLGAGLDGLNLEMNGFGRDDRSVATRSVTSLRID